MKPNCTYRDYWLSAMSTPADDGGYQARVAITMLGADRTRSQRFLDFIAYDSEEEADAQAIEAAKLWVDTQSRRESLLMPMGIGTA
jgi:hypothetical protein